MDKKKFKLLIVDDEEDLREILTFNLASEGYQVSTAANAEEALKMPLEEYHLLILDVMMPGINGFKLAELIRREKKLTTPIIFLTAKGTENDLLTGFNIGADDYMAKLSPSRSYRRAFRLSSCAPCRAVQTLERVR